MVKSGLTSIVILAVVYSLLVFQPAGIWLNLTSGSSIGMVGWLTLFVFVEICRFFGRKVGKEEAALIFLLVGAPAFSAGEFLGFIQRIYFVNSPAISLFGLTGKIPDWWAPLDPRVWEMRTFFHESWIMPLGLSLLMYALSQMVNVSMGLITRQIFLKTMKLRFPIQEVSIAGIVSVTERKEKYNPVLLVGALFAMICSFALYGPVFISDLLGYPPPYSIIPWIDLSFLSQSLLPGSSFGIATDPLSLLPGLILSTETIFSIVIGSFAMYLVANPLIVHFKVTKFAEEYFPGMSIAQIMYRANLYVWAGPNVGISVAAGLVPLFLKRHAIADAFRGLYRAGRERSSGIRFSSLSVLIAMFLLAAVASVVITYLLVPMNMFFFLLLLFMSTFWAFFWTIIDAYSIGVTGMSVQPPGIIDNFIKYSYVSLSGFENYNIWFITPVGMSGTSGSNWCANFKILDSCGVDLKSYFKAWLILIPINFLTGLLFVQIFWSISPIPSSLYRYTAINWPISAISQGLWITGKILTSYDPLWIMSAFFATTGLGAILHITHAPINMIALAAGWGTPTPNAVTILIGWIASRIIARRYGESWWRKNRSQLAAGMAIGESIVLTILSVIVMMPRALYTAPY